MPVIASEIYLGPKVGTLSILQMDKAGYQSSCLQKNSSTSDSTGISVCAACHVLCRFIAMHPELLNNKSAVEIGCGVGTASVVACGQTELSNVLLTDGSDSAIAIAQQNIFNAGFSSGGSATSHNQNRAMALKYSWGDSHPRNPWSDVDEGFDVVFGSDLCYYNTDMATLVTTAKSLLKNGGMGLFIHAHTFRKAFQEEEMIENFSSIGWITAEVIVTDVVSVRELDDYGNAWGRVRCLVSGPRDVVSSLMNSDSSFMEFKPQSPMDTLDDDDDDNDDNGDEAFGLGKMFSS